MMRLEIQSVVDQGRADRERLVLRVRADMDVGDYILIQSDFQGDSVTIATHHTYWFPYKAVKSGDLVVLYTKSGWINEKVLPDGKRVHFFYWGLDEPIWSGEDRAPVLLHAPEWISKSPVELSSEAGR